MEQQYNMRNPAVKRLMKEAQELKDPTEQYFAQPLEDNLFEWHFTIRGPAETEFEGGVYHGRIVLPPEYPMKPPSIILLTPQGRFELNTKICLSISGHHPESWRPSWSIRTALLAIIGFMPTHGGGAIGSLDYTADERKLLARKSRDWTCPQCGAVRHLVKPVTEASKEAEKEAKELASQINFQGEKDKPTAGNKDSQSGDDTVVSDVATPSDVTSPSVTDEVTSASAGAPPLPDWSPEMWEAMCRSLAPPNWPPTLAPNVQTIPTQTELRQRQTSSASTTSTSTSTLTTSTSTSPTSTSASASPARTVHRTVIRHDYDLVSCSIVLVCVTAIALILIRRLGLLDANTLKDFYEQL